MDHMIEDMDLSWLKTIKKHKVPALQLDDGTVITESVVICKYFCQIAKEQSLYPGKNLDFINVSLIIV